MLYLRQEHNCLEENMCSKANCNDGWKTATGPLCIFHTKKTSTAAAQLKKKANAKETTQLM